jgi:hypothetical protein
VFIGDRSGRRGDQRKPSAKWHPWSAVISKEDSVTSPDRSPDEMRIAERYLAVLDDVSGCAEAVRAGDWRALADTADALCRRAALLAEAAGKLHHAATQPPADVVVDIVASRNRTSQAARLLHPPGTIATTAMTDPFTHPGAPPTRR